MKLFSTLLLLLFATTGQLYAQTYKIDTSYEMMKLYPGAFQYIRYIGIADSLNLPDSGSKKFVAATAYREYSELLDTVTTNDTTLTEFNMRMAYEGKGEIQEWSYEDSLLYSNFLTHYTVKKRHKVYWYDQKENRVLFKQTFSKTEHTAWGMIAAYIIGIILSVYIAGIKGVRFKWIKLNDKEDLILSFFISGMLGNIIFFGIPILIAQRYYPGFGEHRIINEDSITRPDVFFWRGIFIIIVMFISFMAAGIKKKEERKNAL